MKWKCVCSTENETDVLKCPNCKRDRPKYLGIELNYEFTNTLSDTGKIEMLMVLVFHNYEVANEEFENYVDSYNDSKITDIEAEKIRHGLFEKLKACYRVLDELAEKSPGFVYSFDDIDIGVEKVRAQVDFLSGRLRYHAKSYKTALDYFRDSFNGVPSQETLFYLAQCVINLPVEAGESMFKSSKRDEAEKIKREIERELLLKVVEFDHIASYGIMAGELLVERYGLIGKAK